MGCRIQNEEVIENGRGFREESVSKKGNSVKVTVFVDLTVKVW
jgi:hypothetical protein